jgi:hypothetical protein
LAAALPARRAGDEGDLAVELSHDRSSSYLISAPASTGSGTPVM